jgi:hypothetical protein
MAGLGEGEAAERRKLIPGVMSRTTNVVEYPKPWLSVSSAWRSSLAGIILSPAPIAGLPRGRSCNAFTPRSCERNCARWSRVRGSHRGIYWRGARRREERDRMQQAGNFVGETVRRGDPGYSCRLYSGNFGPGFRRLAARPRWANCRRRRYRPDRLPGRRYFKMAH